MNWERVARAETHPLRVELLETITHRPEPVSPAWLSVEFDQPLPNVAYHVKGLEKAGLIRLAATRKVRNATEHFYEAAA